MNGFEHGIIYIFVFFSHILGVIAHGIGHFGFFDVHQWPHGSSLTISIIQNVLKIIKEVPRVLYLQMDNCGRENKNRYVFLL